LARADLFLDYEIGLTYMTAAAQRMGIEKCSRLRVPLWTRILIPGIKVEGEKAFVRRVFGRFSKMTVYNERVTSG